MKVRLCAWQQHVCARYFELGHEGRLELAYDLYDAGAVQWYHGEYVLWCTHEDGIFALRRGGRTEGYVLLCGGRVNMFFNAFSQPLDWFLQPCHEVEQRCPTFYADRSFNNVSVRQDEY